MTMQVRCYNGSFCRLRANSSMMKYAIRSGVQEVSALLPCKFNNQSFFPWSAADFRNDLIDEEVRQNRRINV